MDVEPLSPADIRLRRRPAEYGFVQTNAVGGNAVVVHDRLSGGMLCVAGTYATGAGGLVHGFVRAGAAPGEDPAMAPAPGAGLRSAACSGSVRSAARQLVRR